MFEPLIKSPIPGIPCSVAPTPTPLERLGVHRPLVLRNLNAELGVHQSQSEMVRINMYKVSFLTVFCLGAIAVGTQGLCDETTFSGNASWYGKELQGKKTASGELFDMNQLTGAHRTLPLKSKVLVENPKNGKSTIIEVNDRGPFAKKRVMDLSRHGADQLGYLSNGSAHLDFTPIHKAVKATSTSTEMKAPAKNSSQTKDLPNQP